MCQPSACGGFAVPCAGGFCLHGGGGATRKYSVHALYRCAVFTGAVDCGLFHLPLRCRPAVVKPPFGKCRGEYNLQLQYSTVKYSAVQCSTVHSTDAVRYCCLGHPLLLGCACIQYSASIVCVGAHDCAYVQIRNTAIALLRSVFTLYCTVLMHTCVAVIRADLLQYSARCYVR